MNPIVPEGDTVFRGGRFDVRAVEAPRGDGGTVRKDVVVHPGSVVILAVTDADEVVMIRNRRFAVGRTLLELPAGTLEPPERPIQCAARELREEAGHVAETLSPLGRFYSTPGFCNELLHAYLARGLTDVGQALEPGELIEVATIPIRQAKEMMLGGEIADAKTIAALGLYLLGKG